MRLHVCDNEGVRGGRLRRHLREGEREGETEREGERERERERDGAVRRRVRLH